MAGRLKAARGAQARSGPRFQAGQAEEFETPTCSPVSSRVGLTRPATAVQLRALAPSAATRPADASTTSPLRKTLDWPPSDTVQAVTTTTRLIGNTPDRLGRLEAVVGNRRAAIAGLPVGVPSRRQR